MGDNKRQTGLYNNILQIYTLDTAVTHSVQYSTKSLMLMLL